MTWNELIDLLKSIPEDRREEQAVFTDRDNDNWVIDGMAEFLNDKDDVGIEQDEELPGPWACNVGNDDMTSTYALHP